MVLCDFHRAAPAASVLPRSHSMKRIAILGSTGSIGRSTLNVIENNPARFQLLTMAAGSNTEAALNDARRWKPKVLSLATEQDAEQARKQLHAEGLGNIEVVHGQ